MNKRIAVKTIVSVPGWFDTPQRVNKLSGVGEAYTRVPLIFRATRIRCNALCAIPVHLERNGNKVDNWPFPVGPRTLLWRSQAAILLNGAAYWLRQSNKVRDLGLRWLNPFTVSVEGATDGTLTFSQVVGGVTYGPWSQDQMVYLNDFNPADDLGPGVCSADVALGDAELAFYLTRFAAQFFENGAMPITTVSIANLTDPDEQKRVENFFKRAISGLQSGVKRVLAVSEDVKIASTQSHLDELATSELKDQARKDIALAFEIPVTLLDDDANYATAKEHKRSFYDETVLPAGSLIVEELNDQWLGGLGYALRLAPEEMDLYQEDEAARATAFSMYVNGGLPRSVAAEILGVSLPEGWEYADLDGGGAPTPAPAPAPATAPTNALASLEIAQFRTYATKRAKEGRWDKINLFRWNHITGLEQKRLIAWAHTALKDWSYGSKAHVEHSQRYDQRANVHEKKVREASRQLFEDQQKEIIDSLASKSAGSPFDLPSWQTAFRKALMPLIQASLVDAGRVALSDMGLKPDEFDVNNPAIHLFLKAREKKIDAIPETTYADLKGSLDEGVAAGENIAQLQERVLHIMGGKIESTPETIARTEVVSSMNAGTHSAWKGSGVVDKRQWLATLDKRVRDTHAEAHGQTVGIDEPYNVGGEDLMYPGDPAGSGENVINCRCSETAVVEA